MCVISKVSLRNRWPRTGRDTSPPVLSCNFFSEEIKWSRWATYVALGNGTWTVHRSDISPYFLNQCTSGKINCWDLLALELLRALFKPLNHYALFTVSLLSLKRSISQAFLRNALSSSSQNSELRNSIWSLFIAFPCFTISLPISCL